MTAPAAAAVFSPQKVIGRDASAHVATTRQGKFAYQDVREGPPLEHVRDLSALTH